MRADEDAELLTVAEVARLLKVSRVTLHRWRRSGRLRAYRTGPRAVRFRRVDVATLLAPIHPTAEAPGYDDPPAGTTLAVTPPTPEEAKRTLAALAAARELGAGIRARLGDQPFEESWPIIREARDEREQTRGL